MTKFAQKKNKKEKKKTSQFFAYILRDLGLKLGKVGQKLKMFSFFIFCFFCTNLVKTDSTNTIIWYLHTNTRTHTYTHTQTIHNNVHTHAHTIHTHTQYTHTHTHTRTHAHHTNFSPRSLTTHNIQFSNVTEKAEPPNIHTSPLLSFYIIY